MKDVNTLSIKEMAQLELKKEKAEEAKERLKELYSKKHDAEKIVKNIDREIDDYLEQLED